MGGQIISDPWDYIIIGAGSAGCVLANRLSADPENRVLLIEAGPSDLTPLIHIPAALVRLIGNPKYDWAHLAAPDPTRGGKVDLWPAGKTLGGSSSINGMLYVRGEDRDFDAWAQAGATGWSAADVQPYFKKLEDFSGGETERRGAGGPMRVEGLRTTHPLAHIFHQAAQDIGLPLNDDYNDGDQFGVSYSQVTQKRGERFSAARAYLNPVKSRPNLQILTDASVERLKLEGRKCTGVLVRQGDDVTAHTARETLLSAGALGSPKLLMQSGVGPAEQLQKFGLPVIQNAPDVGRNLQEHPNVMISANVYQRTYNMELSGLRPIWHMTNWLLNRRGPVTSPYPHCVAYFKSSDAPDAPSVQVMFGPFAFDFDDAGVRPVKAPVVGASYSLMHPKSAGQITLSGPGPADPIIIDHGMFSDDADMDAMIAAGRRVRSIFEAPAFAEHRKDERAPGKDVTSEEDWAAYIRSAAFLGYHPIRTCRMGSDEDAVVTPDLRVRGVDGLRVVDASVIPSHISANTNAAVMMIAEKASDMILKD